ncbi:putative nuf2 family domain-containing protein [Neospora caninum Liverpool]|uniref:Nuf2 family domain-containing protein, putative n=1 Tax=Neospora caninum (strain Liverpool) TaxID=572307 RepID=F0VMK0_NEOCL|nr:putative nuf2 family domain-containing protein [Neospora caninum Liverpool]CBZ54946.1 putative nuf2 family domain-containing protein [Neospora caninum Liverpool]CEL69668.1 TPA: nuf2 family domain-containing protein, putative [Neospora caninum Liverpool]|eukprot:XP_003884974.1 putative nuf2 family domain-containing protein [Neospora caninum Liverpool]
MASPGMSQSGGLSAHSIYPSTSFSSQGSPFFPSTDRGGRMTLEEIKREFAKHKLECPDTMWREPQPEQVQGLYSFAIESIFSLTVNDVRIEEVTGDVRSCLPSIDSLQFLSQDGRLHAKAIGNLRFFRLCQRLNRVLGLPDFTRETFASPSAAAVLRFASSVCTFLRLKETLWKQFEGQIQQRAALQQSLQKISQDAQLVDQELLRFRAERQTQHPVAQRQKQRRDELESELRQRHSDLGALMEQFAERQAIHGRLELELGDLVLELMNLKQEREELHDQVVHSPEKLMERRGELRLQQKHLDQQLQQLESLATSQQKLLLAFAKALKKAKKAMEILNSHRDKILAPHLGFRSDMRMREKLFREIGEQKEQLSRAVQELQVEREKLSRQLDEQERRKEEEEMELRGNLSRRKQETEDRKKALVNQQEMTTAFLREAERLEERLAEQKERHKLLVEAVEEEIQKVYSAFLTYVSQMQFIRSQMPLSLDLSQSASFLVDHHAEKLQTFSPAASRDREENPDDFLASLLSNSSDDSLSAPSALREEEKENQAQPRQPEGDRGRRDFRTLDSPEKTKRLSFLEEETETDVRMEDLEPEHEGRLRTSPRPAESR